MMSRIFKAMMCVLVINIIKTYSLITYENSDGTFTSFPHNISSNVEWIDISFARFAVIDFIESFPALKRLYFEDGILEEFPDVSNLTLEHLVLPRNKLSVINFSPLMCALELLALGGNCLTHLPDLTNVNSTLQRLYLKDNNIITIHGISHMLVLQYLDMRRNPFIQFPDVRSAGSSLNVLVVHGSQISVIPSDRIAPLVGLPTLRIGTSSGDPITLPNVCLMGRNDNVLRLVMYSEYVTCDWTAVYAKLAERAGRLIITQDGAPSPKCASPAALAERNFHDVTMDKFLHQASQSTISYIYNKISGSGIWACPLQATVIINLSPLACGVICQNMPECIMFATAAGDCIITDINHTSTESAFDVFTDWFVRE